MATRHLLISRVLLVVVWACAAATVVGFVLPWAMIDVHEPGALKALRQYTPATEAFGNLTQRLKRVTVTVRRGAEQITGELPSLADIPTQVSGIQIPALIHQQKAQLALAVLDLLLGRQQHIGVKSYVVYLLPGLALLAAGVLTWQRRNRVVGGGVAVLCAAVSGVGFWKLLTTKTDALIISMTIGPGLWLSLGAYAVLAVAAAVKACYNAQPATTGRDSSGSRAEA